ncbi:MAG: hypothetical protein RJA61_109 [Candidatus Parcubacteria bacterium]|jgi:L-ascorbate metabolism protein UlaG (beta-lactamase superfamily)
MIITYHGISCFKVQFGDTVIAVNPVSKDSKEKAPKFGADIALVSLQDPDHNGISNAAHGERNPFVISGPGEYEIKGVFIKGFPSTSSYGNVPHINTIYYVTLEGMNLCFLGALDGSELKSETTEALDNIDILFVPIGGDGVLSAAQAYKLAVNFEPKIIIPTHTNDAALKAFLKEAGSGVDAIDKLTLKKKDLEGKEGEVVVLAPQN